MSASSLPQSTPRPAEKVGMSESLPTGAVVAADAHPSTSATSRTSGKIADSADSSMHSSTGGTGARRDRHPAAASHSPPLTAASPPSASASDAMNVFEGLRLKMFGPTDESFLLSKVRREWSHTPYASQRPLEPERLSYDRCLLVRSADPSGRHTYHVMPAWLMMVPTWCYFIPWVSAFLAGFSFLVLSNPFSTTLALGNNVSIRVGYAAKALEMVSISLFLLAFLISIWMKAQIDAVDKFRSAEFFESGIDSLRRVIVTLLIESRHWVRTMFVSFGLALSTWLSAVVLEGWNTIPGASDKGNAIAAWAVATGIVGAIWLGFFLVSWRMFRNGTYFLSMDRNVLLHPV